MFMQIIAASDEANPYFLISIALGIFLLQWFLFGMFRREAVKRDLHERGCRPIHIGWRVYAWWAPWLDAMPFRAIYSDPFGLIQKAYCYVDHDLFGPAFGPRRVRWVKDGIINQPHSPEVWVDDEVIRPELQESDASSREEGKR